MKILKLTLKKQWFDMILSGEKTVEYREVKPYFVSRLTFIPKEYFKHWANESIANHLLRDNDNFRYDYDAVEFTNGYSKDSRKVILFLNNIDVGKGKSGWGAEEDVIYFRIHLGKEITRHNFI